MAKVGLFVEFRILKCHGSFENSSFKVGITEEAGVSKISLAQRNCACEIGLGWKHEVRKIGVVELPCTKIGPGLVAPKSNRLVPFDQVLPLA